VYGVDKPRSSRAGTDVQSLAAISTLELRSATSTHLNIDSGEVLSDFATDAAPTGHLTVADGSLLIFLGDGILASFDLDLKKQRWSWKLPKNGPLRGRISGKEMCWLAIVEN
jgi:hypothetical protein